MNEVLNLRKLDHENIMKLYEVYESSEYVYLVSEYVRGETIINLIKMKRICEKEAAEIMQGLLKGLIICHKSGIVHQDIKPGNLIVR